MFVRSKRACHRNKHETPVLYEKIDEEQFFESKILNFSREGLCLLSHHCLDIGDFININIVNHIPGVYGPEQYYSFLGETRWCKPIHHKNNNTSYSAGIQILAKNREMPNKHLGGEKYSCNLCGDFALPRHVTQIINCVYLCPFCCSHFKSLPQGSIKRSIERYLTGNVL